MTGEWVCQISPAGHLPGQVRRGFDDLVRSFAGKKVKVKLSAYRKQRSLNQNCYMHGVVVKMIADARTDRLLAVHIFGPRASDLIAECVTVLEFAGSAEDVARICHAHPTLSEAVHEAALAVDKRAIHI